MEETIQIILKDVLIVASTLLIAWLKKQFDVQDLKTGKKQIKDL